MTLLDHRGQPYELPDSPPTDEEDRPLVGSLRHPFAATLSRGLTPDRLGKILANADRGDVQDYYRVSGELLERDSHYRSVISTRVQAVTSLPFSVMPSGDSPAEVELAEEVQDLLETPEAHAMRGDLMYAVHFGFAAQEIVWLPGQVWRPTFRAWEARHFLVDQDDGQTIRLIGDQGPNGETLDPGKWIVHVPALIPGPVHRAGLARAGLVMGLIKSYGVKDWLSFLDRYGQPLRIGRVGKGATPKEMKELVRALRSLGTNAAVVLKGPQNIEFPTATQPGGTGGDSLFERLARWADEQISKLVLGQTMTSDDGASLAQAVVHNEIRMTIRNDDAGALMSTLQRDLVIPYVRFNYGDRPPPIIEPVIETRDDRKETGVAVKAFVDLGGTVKTEELRQRLLPGFTTPADGDEVLGGRVPQDGDDGFDFEDEPDQPDDPIDGEPNTPHRCEPNALAAAPGPGVDLALIQSIAESSSSYESFAVAIDEAIAAGRVDKDMFEKMRDLMVRSNLEGGAEDGPG